MAECLGIKFSGHMRGYRHADRLDYYNGDSS